MQIDATQSRRREYGRRQYQAVGRDYGRIGAQILELPLCVGVAQADGRENQQTPRFRAQVNGRLRQYKTSAARRPRGLAIDADDLQSQPDQRIQRRNGEIGRSHEDHTHGAADSIGRPQRQSCRALSHGGGALRPTRRGLGCDDITAARPAGRSLTMTVKHELDLRVYYEDTDSSGRVYHASYLRFLERGRTEWLRALGFEHKTLAGATGLLFAVRGLQIEYWAPALMDDTLTIETEAIGTRGAIIEFNQRIIRRGELLVDATIRVVTIRNDRPVRAPRELLAWLGVSGRA